MDLERLKELAVTMYSAVLNSRIPEKHKLHVILIAVSNDGDYMPMTHGIGCNNIIGVLSSHNLGGEGPELNDLRLVCERLALYLKATNLAQEAGINWMLYIISADFMTYVPALFGLKPLTARGVAARAAMSVNQAVIDSVKVEPQAAYRTTTTHDGMPTGTNVPTGGNASN